MRFTDEQIDHLLQFARKTLVLVEQFFERFYGDFHGGDPRNFFPDPDASTEKERANHRAACVVWDRWEAGELTLRFNSVSDCSSFFDNEGQLVMVVTRSQYGLGTNADSRGQELCHKVWRILKDHGKAEA